MEKKKNNIEQFQPDYYDEDYFIKGNKKVTDKVTGETKIFGYKGTDWSGNYHIVQGLLHTFNGEIGSIIDIGAGQGSFTDYAIRAGLYCVGYDFSKWAVDNALNYAKGNLYTGDATNLPEADGYFDLVFCSDLVEHIPQSKIKDVVKEFWRLTRKWVFLQFPVSNTIQETFNAELDDKDHPLYAHLMVAGHLNMQTRNWWDSVFTEQGFKIDDELVYRFRAFTPRLVLANWFNIIILEKP